MECPRCHSTLQSAASSCDSCGFNLSTLTKRLGDQWVRLERLTDAAHCLRVRDSRRIEGLLDEFERRFPQVFLAVYFGVLPHGISVSEAGFWLLNHAAFATHETSKRNDFGMALIIDPASGHAAISVGYAIEHLIRRQEFDQLLLRMSAALSHSDYSEAVHIAIHRIDRLLRSAGRAEPKTAASPPAPAVGHDLGLPRLRAQHRTQASATAADPDRAF